MILFHAGIYPNKCFHIPAREICQEELRKVLDLFIFVLDGLLVQNCTILIFASTDYHSSILLDTSREGVERKLYLWNEALKWIGFKISKS